MLCKGTNNLGPFCKDCKWYDGELWCSSPNNGICSVTGDITLRNAYIHRLNLPGRCGEEGKFFEAKDGNGSLLRRIISWFKGE